MTRAKSLRLAVVGVPDLKDRILRLEDPMLYHAFLLMSQNLAEAFYLKDEDTLETTQPLKFGFSNQTFLFRKNNSINFEHLRHSLLPASDGVIINLAHRALTEETLITGDLELPLLTEMLQIVYEAKLPTVLAVGRGLGAIEDNEAPLPPIIRYILNIPGSIPVIAYSSRKPISIQAVLIGISMEIDKC